MGGGSSHTETVTKQDNTPWGPAQQPLQNIYAAAGNAYAATPKTAYQGSYIAPQSDTTLMAQMFGKQLATKSMGLGDSTIANAGNTQDAFSSALTSAANWNPTQYTPQPIAYTPGNTYQYQGLDYNPMGTDATDYGSGSDYMRNVLAAAGDAPANGDPTKLNAAITAAIDPIYQQLSEQIIPQAKLNAVGSGVYGGDAANIGMSQSINDNYTRNAQNIASQLGYQDYVRQNEDAQKIYAQTLGISADAANNAFTRMLQDRQNAQGLTAAQQLQLNSIGADQAKLAEQQAEFATGTQAQNNQQAMDANKAYNDAILGKLGLLPDLSTAGTNVVGQTADNLQKGFQLNALPIDTLTQIGQAQDSYQQDVVKAMYQKWLDQIQAPWQGLQNYSQAIQGYPTSSAGVSSGSTKSSGGLF